MDHVAPDAKLRARDTRREPGGGGINVARAIRILGGHALAVHLAGGATGDLLVELLHQEEIEQRSVPSGATTRESLHVFEESSGRQFRFVMSGQEPEEGACRRAFDAALDFDPPPDYLVASGSLPPGVPASAYAALSQRARERGVRLVLDASGEALRRAVEAGAWLVKPNVRELGHLAGHEIQGDDEICALGRRLIDRGQVTALVVSLGAGGAVLVTADGCDHVPTPTVPQRSKVGAGDSMLAGIVLSLERGRSLHEAVRFGAAAGAAAVMTPGTELCRRDDAERLYKQMP